MFSWIHKWILQRKPNNRFRDFQPYSNRKNELFKQSIMCYVDHGWLSLKCTRLRELREDHSRISRLKILTPYLSCILTLILILNCVSHVQIIWVCFNPINFIIGNGLASHRFWWQMDSGDFRCSQQYIDAYVVSLLSLLVSKWMLRHSFTIYQILLLIVSRNICSFTNKLFS